MNEPVILNVVDFGADPEGKVDSTEAFQATVDYPLHVMFRHKFEAMLAIQDELNSSKNPNWRQSQHNYEDAIMIETAEMFDQMNWKWWKENPNPVDWNQVKLELVDVWHFTLCRMIVQYGVEEASFELAGFFADHDSAVEEAYLDQVSGNAITDCDAPIISQEEVKDSIRGLMESVMQDNVYEVQGHRALRSLAYLYDITEVMKSLYMTVDELYKLYIGKVELNRLRWAKGYGTTYVKTWFGKEDNVRLIEIMNGLDANDSMFRFKLRAELEVAYDQVEASVRNSERDE